MKQYPFFIAYVVGALLILGGVWGMWFTSVHVTNERIMTPSDAEYPNVSVRGPLTLYAQANVIRKHMMGMSEGKTYAELPRQISKTDEQGRPALDDLGKPIFIDNPIRNTWVTATTLITALYLALMAYSSAALTIILGCFIIWVSRTMNILSQKEKG